MKISVRALTVLLLLGLLAALPATAAADDGTVLATEEPAEEAPASEVGESGVVPAEEAPPSGEEEEEQPWTARFLAPTVLALGVIAFIGSVAYYGVRVRGRYEVVE